MRIQSIRAPIEIRDPARDRLFLPSIQMTFREVNGVAEFEDIAQEIGPVAEALQNTGYLLPPGLATPLIVHIRDLAGSVCVFNNPDFGFGVSHGRIACLKWTIPRRIRRQTQLSAEAMHCATGVV